MAMGAEPLWTSAAVIKAHCVTAAAVSNTDAKSGDVLRHYNREAMPIATCVRQKLHQGRRVANQALIQCLGALWPGDPPQPTKETALVRHKHTRALSTTTHQPPDHSSHKNSGCAPSLSRRPRPASLTPPSALLTPPPVRPPAPPQPLRIVGCTLALASPCQEHNLHACPTAVQDDAMCWLHTRATHALHQPHT